MDTTKIHLPNLCEKGSYGIFKTGFSYYAWHKLGNKYYLSVNMARIRTIMTSVILACAAMEIFALWIFGTCDIILASFVQVVVIALISAVFFFGRQTLIDFGILKKCRTIAVYEPSTHMLSVTRRLPFIQIRKHLLVIKDEDIIRFEIRRSDAIYVSKFKVPSSQAHPKWSALYVIYKNKDGEEERDALFAAYGKIPEARRWFYRDVLKKPISGDIYDGE